MTRYGQTPSQTVGPYFGMRLGGEGQEILVGRDTPGQRLRIEGRVIDAADAYIEDALIEIWQADTAGRYRHPRDLWGAVPTSGTFTGFGRARSAFTSGEYSFETIKPGLVGDTDGRSQAPHINVIVQARGMLMPSFTRIYFSDEAEANLTDRVLSQVPAERRETLVARSGTPVGGVPTYRFDIRFGGDAETVFFDF